MEIRKRYLHLMIDEKFIDHFIDQSESVAPGESDYWIVSPNSSESFRHVKSLNVCRIEWDKHNFFDFSKKAENYNKIFFHSFFFQDVELFLKKLDKRIEVIWMFWGGDGYGFTPNDKQWYLPETRKLQIQEIENKGGLLNQIWMHAKSFRGRMNRSKVIRQRIRNVDICATWVRHDFEMIKHINPRMKWKYYSYFSTEQLGLLSHQMTPLNLDKLWLGNSSTATNNHLDALVFLDKIKYKGQILVPLSYGNDVYKNLIIEIGHKLFGERFIPITKFLPLFEYQELMNSCGIIWMNHIRQQAAGNILTALSLGKIVIMNQQNTLYKSLTEWGIYIENKESIELFSEYKYEKINANREIVIEKLKLERNLNSLRDLFYT